MGQKVSPIGFRLGVNKTWDSKWFREGNYAEWLNEDMILRKFISTHFKAAGIGKVEIERAATKCKVSVYAARPGIVIGKKGVGIVVSYEELAKIVLDPPGFITYVEKLARKNPKVSFF